MKHVVFITGAAGYVGAMLVDQFSRREDVATVISLDKDSMPAFLEGNKKVVWIEKNTADDDWEDEVARHAPDVVIHTAWQIREMYGDLKRQWRWNVEGSARVFDFAFESLSVRRLIHFSTASIYGAYRTNSLEHHFSESEPMREGEYSYGREKKRAEELLRALYEKYRAQKGHAPLVRVVRPAAITGPRGRFMRVRFGLQSALSGELGQDSLYRLVSLMISFVPATPWWARQFVHEDDVCDIIALLSFEKCGDKHYEIYNHAPSGPAVLAPEMARAVGKRMVRIFPWMVRVAYFVMWHLTRGKIPTGKGVWRFYSYPVVMDGTKVSRECGYRYAYDSLKA